MASNGKASDLLQHPPLTTRVVGNLKKIVMVKFTAHNYHQFIAGKGPAVRRSRFTNVIGAWGIFGDREKTFALDGWHD